jgi:hypothetical protein
MLVRTWAGSVVELNRFNFWRWAEGWLRWTLELRPRVPAHQHQALHGDFPPPVKPWRVGTKFHFMQEG